MTAESTFEASSLVQRVSENVTTLMFRMGWHQSAAAHAFAMSQPSLSRKRRGDNDWTLPELERIAAATYVEVSELLGDLPTFEVWRARRDSNPKPSDLVLVEVERCGACGNYYPRGGECSCHHVGRVVVDLAAYRAERVAS